MTTLSSLIDHTLLAPGATRDQIDRLLDEAATHRFASVCVNPVWVSYSAVRLHDTGVDVCTVVGFPLGATTPTVKAFEAREAAANGATEIDMVISVGAAKNGEWDAVEADIRAVREAVPAPLVLKVILETCLLTDEEIVTCCQICSRIGADFVKTSTGFSTGGATTEHVALMKRSISEGVKVKASAGIRTPEQFEAMVDAGADRIGTSAGVALVAGAK